MHLVYMKSIMASSGNHNSVVVPEWEDRPRCECGERAKFSTYQDRRFFHCPKPMDECEFEEWIDKTRGPYTDTPVIVIERYKDYERRKEEYVRRERARRTTMQSLPEREIGVRMTEEELDWRRVARLRRRAAEK